VKPNRYMIFISMGIELVGLVLGSLWVGQVLDQQFQTKGIMVVFFAVAGLASWFVHLIYLLKRIEKLEEQDELKRKR